MSFSLPFYMLIGSSRGNEGTLLETEDQCRTEESMFWDVSNESCEYCPKYSHADIDRDYRSCTEEVCASGLTRDKSGFCIYCPENSAPRSSQNGCTSSGV
jgi:hypothetical protein